MIIDEVKELWSKDAAINVDDLANEAAKICQLHSKYYNIFIDARRQLKKLESKHKLIRRLKREYYLGQLSPEQIKKLEWEPFDLKLLKQEVETYLDSDEHLIGSFLQISDQQILCDFLESIIRTINNRGFHIKNSVDFIRWTNGV